MGSLPDDACPYPRPFPDGFDECAAFERSAASCVNLTIGTYSNGTNHHYGRCLLGDAAARIAVVRNHIVQRDALIRSFVDPDALEGSPPSMPPR